jgi:hypothetical protein
MDRIRPLTFEGRRSGEGYFSPDGARLAGPRIAAREINPIEGSVVFAGYGLVTPGSADEAHNSYAGLDVTNKIVPALRYVPEAVAPERRQELNL